jgi:antitoxin HicB
MARKIRINGSKRKKIDSRDLDFTVIYLPVEQAVGNGSVPAESPGRRRALRKNPEKTGYQVTVPLLPGLVTYGRTLEEAREMAQDAIECHIEGLRKSGEPIPNERLALKGKLHVALSA